MASSEICSFCMEFDFDDNENFLPSLEYSLVHVGTVPIIGRINDSRRFTVELLLLWYTLMLGIMEMWWVDLRPAEHR